ncbi:Spo11/DNA topoisomerase VI subunit A [Scheffersomyces xylosifermentans]|uniref:Spo11/DNA topoisomerase VI subunit A n=1 Tax=Scheffersomyces xylosifermentans TaxID=1304137 RepID=UPI00315D984B
MSSLNHLFQIWHNILINFEGMQELAIQYKSRNYDKRQSLTQFSHQESNLIRFNSYIKIIKLLIQQIRINKNITTIRDFYYRDVQVFQGKSSNCKDTLVSIVEHSLQLSLEKDFNIYPSQKGLMYGNFKLRSTSSRIVIDLHYESEPSMIPLLTPDIEAAVASYSVGETPMVILVEKEAVFKSFCYFIQNSAQHERDIPRNMIIITGKGFPDLLTRRFVNLLDKKLPRETSFLGFVDSDVYGLNILQNYRFGSRTATVPGLSKLRYAGVYLLDYCHGWLEITERDRSLMVSSIRKLLSLDEDSETRHIHREITRGLVLLKKCEMNVYNEAGTVATTGMNNYILGKIKYFAPRPRDLLPHFT